MFSLLVLEYKVIPYDYFMTKMRLWECNYIVEKLDRVDRGAWERLRILLHGILSMFSKKKLKTTDILKFPWEETKVESTDIGAIEEIRKKAKQISEQWQQKY